MDISALPAAVQQAARIHHNGEVSWRDEDAAIAIDALATAGYRLLGLDIRFYFEDGTFYEVPWTSSFSPGAEAKADALDALSRIDEVARPQHVIERRVLITWE